MSGVLELIPTFATIQLDGIANITETVESASRAIGIFPQVGKCDVSPTPHVDYQGPHLRIATQYFFGYKSVVETRHRLLQGLNLIYRAHRLGYSISDTLQ